MNINITNTTITHLPYTTGLIVPFLDNEEKKEKKEVCSICMDNDQFTYKSWVKLKCSHYFHRHCIDLWLENHHTCPICIQDVTYQDNDIIVVIEEIDEEEEIEEEEIEEEIVEERERGCERIKSVFINLFSIILLAFISSFFYYMLTIYKI